VQPSLLRKLCPTLAPEGCWGKFLQFKRISLLVALTTAAVIAGISPLATPFAAPPSKPIKPRRFFDSLLVRPEKPPQFIEAPTPPTAEQVGQTPRSPAAVPVREITPAPVQAVRLPRWDETTAFVSSLSKSAQRVATSAVDPGFQPAPKPKPAQAPVIVEAVAVQRPASGPQAARPATPSPLAKNKYASNKPSGTPAPQSKRLEKLRVRIAQTLAVYQRHPLNTQEHTPWEVMHGFIAFGIPTRVRVGGPAGDLVNAIGWSNMGGRCKGQVMLAASGDRLMAMKGIGVQGHSAQYLAILAQCRVAANSPITLQSKSFHLTDLIEEEKLSCKSGTELTFALIALAHYLPSDAQWKSRDGKAWSLEKLAAEEIEQPIRGAPCGGTHRLFGLAYGCQRRLKATGQLNGVYLRADKFVRDYQKFTLTKLQNSDGSFSTEWFKYPADRNDDVDRKIQTTGHILEWLAASLDQEALYQPRILAAAEFLAAALTREPSREWKVGPLGHALHALSIYQERAWGVVLPGSIAAFHGTMKASQPHMAKQPAAGTRRADNETQQQPLR